MRRRFLLSTMSASVLAILVAGTALGAHCRNASKPDGAGVQGTVVIDAATGEATFIGLNAGGKLPGGFADVWLDVDGDGVGDVQLEDDIFLVSNHSHKANPAQGVPAVLPSAEHDPGGPDHGVGFGD